MRRFFSGFAVGIGTAALALLGVGHVLSIEDPLQHTDVIVALSGDTGARAETAVDLWKRGYAPVILFAGGSEDPRSASSAELMKRQAVVMGVPADRVLVEGQSATTEENALLVAKLMRERELRSAILVTSPYHQRRAAVLFDRAFQGTDMTFRNYPARDASWDPSLWWVEEPTRSLTMVEIAKLAVEIVGVPFR